MTFGRTAGLENHNMKMIFRTWYQTIPAQVQDSEVEHKIHAKNLMPTSVQCAFNQECKVL